MRSVLSKGNKVRFEKNKVISAPKDEPNICDCCGADEDVCCSCADETSIDQDETTVGLDPFSNSFLFGAISEPFIPPVICAVHYDKVAVCASININLSGRLRDIFGIGNTSNITTTINPGLGEPNTLPFFQSLVLIGTGTFLFALGGATNPLGTPNQSYPVGFGADVDFTMIQELEAKTSYSVNLVDQATCQYQITRTTEYTWKFEGSATQALPGAFVHTWNNSFTETVIDMFPVNGANPMALQLPPAITAGINKTFLTILDDDVTVESLFSLEVDDVGEVCTPPDPDEICGCVDPDTGDCTEINKTEGESCDDGLVEVPGGCPDPDAPMQMGFGDIVNWTLSRMGIDKHDI